MSSKKIRLGFGCGRRRMAVESLESRAMLAGNVFVSVAGNNLLIRGDSGGNGVLLSQVGSGEYAVTGIDWAGSATRINGSANATLYFGGVTGDIIIDMQKGDDALGIGNDPEALRQLAIECGIDVGLGDGWGTTPTSMSQGIAFIAPRNLIINTGDGADGVALIANVRQSAIINTGNQDDAVAIGDSSFGNDLIAVTGNGADHLCIGAASIGDFLDVQTGNQNDFVSIGPGSLGFAAAPIDMGSLSAGHARIVTGNGDDSVGMLNFHVDRELVIDTGSGNDNAFLQFFSVGGQVVVATGIGNDEAHLSDFSAGDVVVDTGAGNDGSPSMQSPVTVQDATIINGLKLVTGSGNDIALVENISARNVLVDTGANDDLADIIDLIVRNDLNVFLGSGNDQASIGHGQATLEVGHNLLLDAGAGNDEIGIGNVTVQHDLLIYLGAGNDTAGVDHATVGNLTRIDAGAGNDSVTIVNGILNQLQVFLGIGDDALAIAGSSVNKALLRGGSRGFDSLTLQTDVIGTLDKAEFEFVNVLP
jgi:hypothetical protein